MYKLEHATKYFSILSFRQRRPGRKGIGHMRWCISVDHHALIRDDLDLDLVYNALHSSQGPAGYGLDRTFKTREAAEHMLTMLLLRCSR